MKRVVVVLVAALLIAGCGGGGTKSPEPSTATRRTTTTSTSSPASTSTSSTCAPGGAVTDVRVDYPNRMSSLVGKDVRTGAHPCRDRFVIELQASDLPNPEFPGYWVRYATGPVGLSPAGIPVTLRGGVVLLASLGSPMQRTDLIGYSGPRDVFPTNVRAILEYRLIEDFEGQSTWAIGIDTRRSFEVSVLSGPPRLVIDIQTSP